MLLGSKCILSGTGPKHQFSGLRAAHQVGQVIIGQAEAEQVIQRPTDEAEWGRCMKVLLGTGRWRQTGPIERGNGAEGCTAQLLAAFLLHVKER